MHPRIWGRDMWRSIHYVALGFPVREPSPEVRQAYMEFFVALGSVLPCVKCAKHYNEHLQSYPVESSLVGRGELFRWTVDLHNAVNSSLGRPTWSYERAYQVYADRRSPQEPSSDGQEMQVPVRRAITMIVSLLVLVGFVVWWVRRRRRIITSLSRTRWS